MDENLKPLPPFDPNVSRGLRIDPISPKDFIMGVNSPIFGDVEPTGVWTAYVSPQEVQADPALETDNCTGFAIGHSIEDQINRMIMRGLIRPVTLEFLRSNGYLVGGLVRLSKRAIGSLAGTGPQGNSLQNVANSVLKTGVVPDSLWPWDQAVQTTYATYYAPVSQAVLDLGQQFLKHFALAWHWAVTDPSQMGNIPNALRQAPLYDALCTCGGWSTDNPIKWCNAGNASNHAVVSTDVKQIQDSYIPQIKNLSGDYLIPYAMVVQVTQLDPDMPLIPAVKVAQMPTVYIQLANFVWVAVASWQSFLDIGGTASSIKVIDQATLNSMKVIGHVFLERE